MSSIVTPFISPGWTFTTFSLSVFALAVVAVNPAIVSSHSHSLFDVDIAKIASICLAMCALYKSATDTQPFIEDLPAFEQRAEYMRQRLDEQRKRIKTLELESIERNSLQEEKQEEIQIQIHNIAKREAEVAEREQRAHRYEDSIDGKLLLLNTVQRRMAETKEEHDTEVAMLQAQLLQAGVTNQNTIARIDELFRQNVWQQAEKQSLLANLATLSFENQSLKASKHSQDAEIRKLQIDIASLRQKNDRSEKIIQENHTLWSTEVRPLEMRVLAAERAKRVAENGERKLRGALDLQREISKNMVSALEKRLSNLKAKYKSTQIDQLEEMLDTERKEAQRVRVSLREAEQTIVMMAKDMDTLNDRLSKSGRDMVEKHHELSLCMDIMRDLNAEIDELKQWQTIDSTAVAISTSE